MKLVVRHLAGPVQCLEIEFLEQDALAALAGLGLDMRAPDSRLGAKMPLPPYLATLAIATYW